MDKAYIHKNVEDKIYSEWEEKEYFKPEVNPNGKPYCIILPPPNANGALHFGHAMFAIEDVLIRYHRMLGEAALWVPGADHAGIETQFVFEKKLKAEGKSRLDYDQATLYSMIHEYVEENRGGIEKQLRKLGFSLDWSREKYTLDPDIIKLVYKTFHQMYQDGLVYRDYKLVNYCTFDGTSFSDLEVVNEEREGTLYHLKFPIKEGGDITIATTRPETFLGDVAVMVNPEDSRYKDVVGKTVVLPLINREIPIIADAYVKMDFGTGAVKVTPNHDFNDFEIAKKHKLTFPPIIGFDGKMQNTGIVDGLYVKQARPEIVQQLKDGGFLVKEETHKIILPLCYKCKNVLEPLPLEQWFVKVKSLTEAAIQVVREGKVKITPKNFEKLYFQWLENLRDWNISRQIVWGIRIPAWKCDDCDVWQVTEGEAPKQCTECKSLKLTQDTDTFDTWFSSGQWPYLTLKTGQPGDFDKFYPTAVMETGYDLLKAWVSRMVMLGLYVTDDIPFNDVLFHGLVNDPYGKKMSKSKGNVINPLELVDQYGADAVRFALIYGNATGNDQALSYTKLDAARKFANKLWNMGRFIEMQKEKISIHNPQFTIQDPSHDNDKAWLKKTEELTNEVTKYLDNYQFNLAAERLYEFAWHEFADIYIEDVKNRIDENSFYILRSTFYLLLKLLHPFMPFITEEIARELKLTDKMLIVSSWPTHNE